MNRLRLGLTLLALGLLAHPALADPPNDAGKRADRPNREQMRERMIEEFDKDGDGKLSEEEREKARESMRERFGRRAPEGRPGREGGPRGKDGKGSKAHRGHHAPGGGPSEERLDHLFKRFDEDENESLSREEFGKLAEFVRQHLPGPPRGPRFDGRRPEGPPPRGDEFRRRRPEGPHGFDGPGPRDRGGRGGERPPRPPRPENPPSPPPVAEGNADEAI